MKKDKLREGIELCLDNSDSLLKVADSSNKLSKYGIATSLSILAAEESIKALKIFEKMLLPKTDIANYNNFFREHKTKHKSIIETLKLVVFLNKSYEFIYEPIINNAKNISREEVSKQHKKGISKLSNWVDNIKSKDSDFSLELNWWKEANTLKNKGFYVDAINNEWYTPKKITKRTYLKERKYVENIVNEIRKLVLIIRYENFDDLLNGNIFEFITQKNKNDD